MIRYAMLAIVSLGLVGCGTVNAARERIAAPFQRCQDQVAPIYFLPGQAEITADGRRVITETAARARNCQIERVSIVGLADATGDAAVNLELSKRRAQAVTAAFAAAGLPTDQFDIAAAGQIGAVTAEGATAPLRRRAEVTLHLKPR